MVLIVSARSAPGGGSFRQFRLLTDVGFEAASRGLVSPHEPAVGHHQRLAGQRIRLERCEEQRRLGDVLDSGELAVNRVLEHDLLDNILL